MLRILNVIFFQSQGVVRPFLESKSQKVHNHPVGLLLSGALGCLGLVISWEPADARAQDLELKNGTVARSVNERGDRIPDYSFAGYRASESPIPLVAIQAVVGPPEADNTAAIQSAIDLVSNHSLNESGFRGAVLLPPGLYPVKGTLRISKSGVVLRGAGYGNDGTKIVATGTSRRAVIEIRGEPATIVGTTEHVLDPYVPVDATKIQVSSAASFVAGSMIQIMHPSTKPWIDRLQMQDLGGDRHGPSWRPGSRDIHWLRTVTRSDADTLELDAPLTLGIDSNLAIARVVRLDTSGWVRHAGVENLSIESTFDSNHPKDEEHAWYGVSIHHARDVWVRRLVCKHLVGSAVAVWQTSSRVTVEDCKSLQPVGEVGGWRRNAFSIRGQQILMQRLYSEGASHDFFVGATAPGPNAWVQCESFHSFGESGSLESAACGTLFDRVKIDNQPLSMRNRKYQAQGVGWTSFNGLFWNCTAPLLIVEKPVLGQNWAVGTHGEYSGDGSWSHSDDPADPPSLFYELLNQRRVSKGTPDRANIQLPIVSGSRAPTLEQAEASALASKIPRPTMSQWIDHVCSKDPLEIHSTIRPMPSVISESSPDQKHLKHMVIHNGWITIGGKLAIGQEVSVPWWNGGVRPDDLRSARLAVTRFVPGQTGKGFTDDLEEVADAMSAAGQTSLWQHPPLWYDRRRDDHSRTKRLDGDVVPPFYEMPWARSGLGIASDGLSKWDLTKSNRWYFDRLRYFAKLGEEKGILLFNGLYNQHSLLEAGAHYVDSPWRPENNIHPVDLPEPPVFASDKLIYYASLFYESSNPVLTKLQRGYARNVLDELSHSPNVVLFLSEEYTGPRSFVETWLDTIRDWIDETGHKPCIALYATKDVTDAILEDPDRSRIVSILYNRFHTEGWWYQPDGALYAPQGGKNLSPRQWIRLLKPKAPGFAEIVKGVREYRTKYPTKPFVYQGNNDFAWAVLLGGGSLAPLPKSIHEELLLAIPKMRPMPDQPGLIDDEGNQLIYSEQTPTGPHVQPIDMKTGKISDQRSNLYWVTNDAKR